MTLSLDQFLRRREAEILARWEERLAATGLDLRVGSPEERRRRHRDALEAVILALAPAVAPGPAPGSDPGPATGPAAGPASGPAAAALPFAVGMARIEIRRPGHERNQADTVLAMLLGREVVRDLLAAEVAPSDLPPLVRELDRAFNGVISLYGQTTCAMCRARQEESRVRVERHLDSVLENSQDAIVLCDLECRIEHWNAGAEALFGWGAADMRGASIDRLLPGGRWEEGARERLLEELEEHGHARMPERELARRDGAPVWVDVSYTLVREAHGPALGIWILFRDVSEQRRLLDDRLHAERLALVGAMSARFAHEIRNPLTSILINLDLLRDSIRHRGEPAAGEEDDDTVSSIAEEVNRIQKVVQDYLRFGRKAQPQREPVGFDDLLRRHLAMIGPELVQRDVELHLDLAAGDAVIDADEDQLWQAVLNLVRNGMEAMPGGGRLTIRSARADGRVTCAVEDTGTGMAPEVQEEMFRPFYSTKKGGTGLGMPFVRQVLTEHGGALACHSVPGQGTRMSFMLPIVTPHDD